MIYDNSCSKEKRESVKLRKLLFKCYLVLSLEAMRLPSHVAAHVVDGAQSVEQLLSPLE